MTTPIIGGRWIALAEDIDRAIARRRRADEEYQEALEAYIAAGGSYSDLARLLGISRQAARKAVLKGEQS